MNKRIQQLSNQANEWASKEESYKSHSQLFTEKFAELIVRECADLVQKHMTRWPEDCELTKQIKEHFGVER